MENDTSKNLIRKKGFVISQKKGFVISQISTPLVVFLVVMTIVNSIVLFVYNIIRYSENGYERAVNISEFMAREMEDYECIEFLLRYWDEHSGDMELIYNDPERVQELEAQFDERMDGENTDVQYVTNEGADALDEEGKRLLAEICYAKLALFFDETKQTYQVRHLYSFNVVGDKIVFNITGALEDEKRVSQGGDIYEPGVEKNYVPGKYPILDKVLETGELPRKMELMVSSGIKNSVIHAYRPIFSEDGELIDIVAVSLEWRRLVFAALPVSGLVATVSAVLFLLAGAWMYYLVKRVVSEPLTEERDIMIRYREQKDAVSTRDDLEKIKSGNEIEELAESFSSIVTEVDRYVNEIKKVTAEKERIGAELSIATRIQADMLPRVFPPFPDRKEIDIYASMKPAKEVGGDFYDFFFTDDDHLALVIADVSGKGVPAALFMVISKTLLKNSATRGENLPSVAFGDVNRLLLEGNDDDLFVTVWMGILTVSTGKMMCSNAGHEYPAIRRKNGNFELLMDNHSMPLATIPDVEYKDYEMEFHPGDTLFVYTDGVTEAMNRNEQLFGTERMLDALNRCENGDDPYEPERIVKKAVSEFEEGTPQFDDMTMMTMIYRGV